LKLTRVQVRELEKRAMRQLEEQVALRAATTEGLSV
jgi:hypothetical protein